jgi:L-amino acid N-acyltransferase YncA
MINIRPAVIDDVTEIAAMVLSDNFWEHVNNFDTSINVPDAMAYITYMINNEKGMVYVATFNNKVVAFMLGEIYKNWWNNDLVSTDYALYVHSKYRNMHIGYKLLKHFVTESESKGATKFVTGVMFKNFNAESVGKLLIRQGFKPVATMYEKEFK